MEDLSINSKADGENQKGLYVYCQNYLSTALQLQGYKRKKTCLGYIILEHDGMVHSNNKGRDTERDEKLKEELSSEMLEYISKGTFFRLRLISDFSHSV